MNFYQSFIRPLLFRFDSERIHKVVANLGIATQAVPGGLSFPRAIAGALEYPELQVTLFGQKFKHPVGLAAGFDKNAEVFPFLCAYGFSFAELGSVTLYPQPGNPKPRIFRDIPAKDLYNAAGFPNVGHEEFYRNRIRLGRPVPLGLSLGKMKHSTPEMALHEYRLMARRMAGDFDYVVVNMSSPNTPGLRDFQKSGVIEEFLAAIGDLKKEINATLGQAPAWLVKISPNLSESEMNLIVDHTLRNELDGIVATNTIPVENKSFPHGPSELTLPACGLSGKSLTERSTEVIRYLYERSEGRVPIIGVGGIFTGRDAYRKIKQGASLVQLYTAFIYEGPTVVAKIVRELRELVHADGFENIQQAVGSAITGRARQPEQTTS